VCVFYGFCVNEKNPNLLKVKAFSVCFNCFGESAGARTLNRQTYNNQTFTLQPDKNGHRTVTGTKVNKKIKTPKKHPYISMKSIWL
jgi:hypothetical protein